MKKLFLALLFLPLFTIAQESTYGGKPGDGTILPIPKPNTYVNDLAGLLNETQINELNLNIRQIETDYSIQIAIVLVKTTGDIQIDDYARQIGRSWHVGNAKNGLVYVAALDDHKQRLEVAQNLEGTITDIRAHELTDIIKGFFQHQQYYTGLDAMLKSLTVMLKPVEAEQKGLGNAELKKKNSDHSTLPTLALIFIILSIGCLLVAYVRKRITAAREKAEEAERAEMELRQQRIWEAINLKINTFENLKQQAEDRTNRSSYANGKPIRTYNVTPERVPDHKKVEDSGLGFAAGAAGYVAGSSSSDNSSSSSSSSSSDYGNWGSDSSSSSSSFDSGFSGGGSSNDL